MGLQNINKSRAMHGGYILFVGEKFYAACFEKRDFWWKASSGFVLAGQLLGFDLAGFDVGLVEGVNADQGAGDGSSYFPAEKFLTASIGAWEDESNPGVPGLFQSGPRGIP